MNLISLFLLLAYPKLLNQKKSQPTTMQRTQEKHMIYKHIPPHQRRFRQKIRKKMQGIRHIYRGGGAGYSTSLSWRSPKVDVHHNSLPQTVFKFPTYIERKIRYKKEKEVR